MTSQRHLDAQKPLNDADCCAELTKLLYALRRNNMGAEEATRRLDEIMTAYGVTTWKEGFGVPDTWVAQGLVFVQEAIQQASFTPEQKELAAMANQLKRMVLHSGRKKFKRAVQSFKTAMEEAGCSLEDIGKSQEWLSELQLAHERGILRRDLEGVLQEAAPVSPRIQAAQDTAVRGLFGNSILSGGHIFDAPEPGRPSKWDIGGPFHQAFVRRFPELY